MVIDLICDAALIVRLNIWKLLIAQKNILIIIFLLLFLLLLLLPLLLLLLYRFIIITNANSNYRHFQISQPDTKNWAPALSLSLTTPSLARLLYLNCCQIGQICQFVDRATQVCSNSVHTPSYIYKIDLELKQKSMADDRSILSSDDPITPHKNL